MEVKSSPHGKIKVVFQSILPSDTILNSSHDASADNFECKSVVESKLSCVTSSSVSYHNNDSPNTQVLKFIDRINQLKHNASQRINSCKK